MDQIEELLTRGVANIIPNRDELEKTLRSDRKLNVYCGFDVTAPHLHIGNAVPLRKLQHFVDLGHHVTFLIGDFTTLVGDTSDKDSERPVISESDIDKNWQDYASQAGKILDLSQVTVRRNSEWLDRLSHRELIKLIRHFSLNDFNSRELIKRRLASGNSVNLSEVIYPVLQGYDSYFMDTDIQIGATDQTFNMQAGRTLQKLLRGKDSFVMAFNFLMGTDGRKMSKSWGNAVWLDDSPEDIFGKVMSIKDDLIESYFLLATNLPKSEFPDISANPLAAKKQLAYQITKDLAGETAAAAAQKHFETTVQNRQIPDDIPQIQVKSTTILDVLVETRLAPSKSAARRLIDQGGVKINGQKITDHQTAVSSPASIQVGSRRSAKIFPE